MKKFTSTIGTISTVCSTITGLLGTVSLLAVTFGKTAEDVRNAVNRFKG